MKSQKYNIYNSLCPSHKLLAIIGDKWIILIIQLLSEKTFRFGELHRTIEGISKKVLTQALRNLEEHGLIQRVVYDDKQLKVEYSLTILGRSLNTACKTLTVWAEQHIEAIEKFRAN